MARARPEDRSHGDRSRRAPPAGAPRQAGSPAQETEASTRMERRGDPHGSSRAVLAPSDPFRPSARLGCIPTGLARLGASDTRIEARGAAGTQAFTGPLGAAAPPPVHPKADVGPWSRHPRPRRRVSRFGSRRWRGGAGRARQRSLGVARSRSPGAALDAPRGTVEVKSAGAGPRSRASAGRPPGATNGRPDVRDKAPCVRRCPRGSPGARWSALAVGSGRPAVRLRPPNAPARAWSAIAALSGERAAIALPGAAGGKPDPPRLRRFPA